MAKQITLKQREIIVKSLAEGKTLREAGKLSGTSTTAVSGLRSQSDIIKKEVEKELRESLGDSIKDLAKSFLNIAHLSAQALTKEKIERQSGAAIATTAAIMVDKFQLLTGGATENIQAVESNKDTLLQEMTEKPKSIESAKMSGIIDVIKPETGNEQENALKIQGE